MTEMDPVFRYLWGAYCDEKERRQDAEDELEQLRQVAIKYHSWASPYAGCECLNIAPERCDLATLLQPVRKMDEKGNFLTKESDD